MGPHALNWRFAQEVFQAFAQEAQGELGFLQDVSRRTIEHSWILRNIELLSESVSLLVGQLLDDVFLKVFI